MKNVNKRILSFFMILAIAFTVSLNLKISIINAQETENLEVEIRDENYLTDLIATNDYLSNKVEEKVKYGITEELADKLGVKLEDIEYSNIDIDMLQNYFNPAEEF